MESEASPEYAGSGIEISGGEKYSPGKIILIWVLATAPMTFFAFVLTPAVIGWFSIPDSVHAFMVFWLFMIFVLVWQFVPMPDDPGTLFPFLTTLPHYNLAVIMNPEFEGLWLILCLTLVTIPFNYFLGEEFLFREILLPKMNGVFGKWDWFFNGIFFALYHLHKPPGILIQAIFTGFMLSYPSKRFRSNWMAVIVHGIKAPISIIIVLGIIPG